MMMSASTDNDCSIVVRHPSDGNVISKIKYYFMNEKRSGGSKNAKVQLLSENVYKVSFEDTQGWSIALYTHRHTHTLCIYIYIYVCLFVDILVCFRCLFWCVLGVEHECSLQSMINHK